MNIAPRKPRATNPHHAENIEFAAAAVLGFGLGVVVTTLLAMSILG